MVRMSAVPTGTRRFRLPWRARPTSAVSPPVRLAPHASPTDVALATLILDGLRGRVWRGSGRETAVQVGAVSDSTLDLTRTVLVGDGWTGAHVREFVGRYRVHGVSALSVTTLDTVDLRRRLGERHAAFFIRHGPSRDARDAT